MSLPRTATRDEWLAARKELLTKEKELTRRRDALNVERRKLPMVKIEKDYVFEGPDGEASLLDLFEGRRQLIVGHFMFDPGWDDGCSSCSAGADEVADGLLEHLHARDTSFAYISRAPIEKIERYRAKKGWTFPWYSSYGSEFNYDFGVTVDEAVAPPNTTTAARPSTSAPARPTTSKPRSRSNSPARAASCATARSSFTPTRRTAVAPRCWVAPTTGST